MSFAEVLPLAFVMIAGPQIITSFFFATSPAWKKTSLSYVAGAAVSVTGFVSAAYWVGRGAKSGASTSRGTMIPGGTAWDSWGSRCCWLGCPP